MKCIHCDREVSMWATVCPHCYRKPGNIIENAIIRFIRWIIVIGLILGGILSLFVGGSSDKSAPKVNNQPVKTQEQSVQNAIKTENMPYTENNPNNSNLSQDIENRLQNEEIYDSNNTKNQKHEDTAINTDTKSAKVDIEQNNTGIKTQDESSSLNEVKVDFGPYMKDLQRRIKRNWEPPRSKNVLTTNTLFKISKDGRLLDSKILTTSGDSDFDNAALRAIQMTAPFKPLPQGYNKNSVDINFSFDNK